MILRGWRSTELGKKYFAIFCRLCSIGVSFSPVTPADRCLDYPQVCTILFCSWRRNVYWYRRGPFSLVSRTNQFFLSHRQQFQAHKDAASEHRFCDCFCFEGWRFSFLIAAFSLALASSNTYMAFSVCDMFDKFNWTKQFIYQLKQFILLWYIFVITKIIR